MNELIIESTKITFSEPEEIEYLGGFISFRAWKVKGARQRILGVLFQNPQNVREFLFARKTRGYFTVANNASVEEAMIQLTKMVDVLA